MDKVKLIFNNVSEILGNERIGLIVLTNEQETRQIAIVCDDATKTAIDMRVKKMPETKLMLPEIMTSMLRAKGNMNYEVLITDIKDGQYLTMIYDAESGDSFPIKASHAILFALISNTPIYIEEKLMRQQSNTFTGSREKLAVPINVISESMLKESLERAIEEENYEMASKLNQELNRRKKKENNL